MYTTLREKIEALLEELIDDCDDEITAVYTREGKDEDSS